MSEQNFNLEELEELKTQYSLVEEELDGKEIVSDDKIRETLCRKFAVIRSDTKDRLLWINLLAIPVFTWYFAQYMPSWIIWMMAIYWLVSLLFKLYLLRKTGKEEYGSVDLKTLTEKEAGYNRRIMAASVASVLFWVVFMLLYCITDRKAGVISMTAVLLAVLIGVCFRKLVIKYKYDGKKIDPSTGKPRKLNPKGTMTFFECILAIYTCCIILNVIQIAICGKSIIDLLNVIDCISTLLADAALFLVMLLMTRKVNVSLKLVNTLIVISLALLAAITIVALLTDNIASIQKSYMLITVCLCSMAHYYIRQKKDRKK